MNRSSKASLGSSLASDFPSLFASLALDKPTPNTSPDARWSWNTTGLPAAGASGGWGDPIIAGKVVKGAGGSGGDEEFGPFPLHGSLRIHSNNWGIHGIAIGSDGEGKRFGPLHGGNGEAYGCTPSMKVTVYRWPKSDIITQVMVCTTHFDGWSTPVVTGLQFRHVSGNTSPKFGNYNQPGASGVMHFNSSGELEFVEQRHDKMKHFTLQASGAPLMAIGGRAGCVIDQITCVFASNAPVTTPAPHPPPMHIAEGKAVVTPITSDSDMFWQIEKEFRAGLNGRIDDYVRLRIEQKKKPINFRLLAVSQVSNPVLEAQFQRHKTQLSDKREETGFHGTAGSNIMSICNNGLLRVGHPLNPSRRVDEGFFGMPEHGIYLSRHIDYTLKYANQMDPLSVGDTCRVIMFRVLPGRSRHITAVTKGLKPSDSAGFDSHLSPRRVEWYLFSEAQCCPTHILTIKAIEDDRTCSDDGL